MISRNARILPGFWWVFALFLAQAPLWGQKSQNIVGTIKDETGAVVPGATVAATHTATNTTGDAISNDRGDYRIIRLSRVGAYEVKASLSGFKTAVASNILMEDGSDRAGGLGSAGG